MIKSVAKAVEIMHLFTAEEPCLSLVEISRRSTLPKSTAHNLLNTLVAAGFVEKVDGDRYALGTAPIALTQAIRVNVELRDRAAPLLRRLADDSRESVYLTIPDQDQCLYIYAIESPKRLLARTAVGDRAPMHCTAVGKAILAFLSDKEIKKIIARVGLRSFTPSTITSLPALRADLAKIASRGFSVDSGEHEEGTYCIGTPILNERGKVIAACSISGTDPEIVRGRLSELSSLVISTAQGISRLMGYVPSRMPVVLTKTISL